MKQNKRDSMNSRTLTIGEFLRQLRKDEGVRQSDLAKQLGVKTSTYSAYENGRIKPAPDKLYALAQYYDINVELLVSKVKGSDETDSNTSNDVLALAAIKEAKDEVAMMEELVYYFRNLRPAHKKAVYELAKSLYIS